MDVEQDPLDGRTARKRRNRELVIDTVLDAIEDGDAVPSIRKIAELAGVSERSIFRYFGEIDELLAAAVEAGVDRYRPDAQISDEGRGTIDDRIDALVDARMRFWLRSDAISSLIRSRAQDLALAQVRLVDYRGRLRAQAERHLGDLLDRLPAEERSHALHMIEVAVSYESFRVETDAGTGLDEIRARWRYAVGRLLTPPGH